MFVKNEYRTGFILRRWFKLFPFCNWIRPWISGPSASIQWSWLGWSDQLKIFLEELIEFTCYFQDIFSENVNRSRIFGNQLKMEPLTPIFRLLLWLKPYNVSSENLILDQQKIPWLKFFFILFAYLHDILLTLLGEILSRSYVGIQWLTSLPVQVSSELPHPMFCIQCWHNDYEKRKDISIQPHFVKISCYTDFATRIIQNFAGTSRASSYEPNWPGWPAYRDEFRLEFIWENSARFPRWEKAEDPGDEFWREIRKTKQRWRNATKLLLLRLLWLWQPF